MKNKPTRIAVLLCTHNGEQHIGEQLRSLAKQTHPPAALFVHDWCSTDSTVAQVLAFARHCGNRIPVVMKQHSDTPGAKDSFLRAIGECIASDLRFDHLALCDQDDTWSPNKLEVFASYLDRPHPPDILHSDARLVDTDGNRIADSFYTGATAFQQPRCLQDPSILLTNPVIGMTMTVSMRCLTTIGPELAGPWLMHDWAIVLLALSHGFKTAYIPEQLVNYRQHRDNVLGAGTGFRLLVRLRKARAHFARVRTQIAWLNRVPRPWPPLAARILRGGALQRFHAAQAAFRSQLLGRVNRLLLGCAILLLW